MAPASRRGPRACSNFPWGFGPSGKALRTRPGPRGTLVRVTRDDTVRVPKRLLVELLQVAKRSLEQLDEVSRSRWEFNRVRLELEELCKRQGLDELIRRSEAGAVDTLSEEKTPVRRPSAAMRAAGLRDPDDEPTRPDLPHLKRRQR